MNSNLTPKTNTTKSRIISTQVLIGLVVVLVGLGILLRRMDFPLPDWLFGWEMILIIVGVISGINTRFKDISWIIPIIIGSVFLIDDVFPGAELSNYVWPVGIIVIGLIIAFKPRFSGFGQKPFMGDGYDQGAFTNQATASSFQTATADAGQGYTTSSDDMIEATAIFGGVKRSVVSKQFRGGEIVSIFGGSEINLVHADFHGIIKLEVVNVLGGTKLIVPANWDVQSTMVAVFGGVDDKRIIRPELIDPNKKLIIEGTSFLGGLEIRSF